MSTRRYNRCGACFVDMHVNNSRSAHGARDPANPHCADDADSRALIRRVDGSAPTGFCCKRIPITTTSPRIRQPAQVQRRIEWKPSPGVASKRIAPQWRWPARTPVSFAVPCLLSVSPLCLVPTGGAVPSRNCRPLRGAARLSGHNSSRKTAFARRLLDGKRSRRDSTACVLRASGARIFGGCERIHYKRAQRSD